ncbi:flap endonuclease-1 [Nanoarchaeota archaeon]|nr:MAG: flap endonuclease-1 [Nanoarchaeota archaeon]
MGVDIREIVSGKKTTLEGLSGKKVAVDAYNAIYQFLSIIRQRNGTPLMDSKGRITSHLSGIFYRNVNLLEKGIFPIYVFDGKPPEFKAITKQREERKKEAEKLYKEALEAGDLSAARKYAQQMSRLTDEMIEDAKALLRAMGIPIVQAPSEGEAQAAHMCGKGDVWASASQDYDTLLFGSPRLVRNLNITGKRKLPGRDVFIEISPEVIELERVLKELGIDREGLVVIGILVGTDYNPGGIKGIGPKRALELVKKHGKGALKQFEFEVDPYKILEWFMNPKVTDEYDIKRREVNREEVLKILCDEHDFSRERVENALNKLGKGTQTSLGSFFH